MLKMERWHSQPPTRECPPTTVETNVDLDALYKNKRSIYSCAEGLEGDVFATVLLENVRHIEKQVLPRIRYVPEKPYMSYQDVARAMVWIDAQSIYPELGQMPFNLPRAQDFHYDHVNGYRHHSLVGSNDRMHGLRPTMHWGIDVSFPERPLYACCQRPLDSPGCWIRLPESNEPIGEQRPYRLFWDFDLSDVDWKADSKTIRAKLNSYTQIGTMFLNVERMQALHQEIQTLLPGVIRQVSKASSDDTFQRLYDAQYEFNLPHDACGFPATSNPQRWKDFLQFRLRTVVKKGVEIVPSIATLNLNTLHLYTKTLDSKDYNLIEEGLKEYERKKLDLLKRVIEMFHQELEGSRKSNTKYVMTKENRNLLLEVINISVTFERYASELERLDTTFKYASLVKSLREDPSANAIQRAKDAIEELKTSKTDDNLIAIMTEVISLSKSSSVRKAKSILDQLKLDPTNNQIRMEAKAHIAYLAIEKRDDFNKISKSSFNSSAYGDEPKDALDLMRKLDSLLKETKAALIFKTLSDIVALNPDVSNIQVLIDAKKRLEEYQNVNMQKFIDDSTNAIYDIIESIPGAASVARLDLEETQAQFLIDIVRNSKSKVEKEEEGWKIPINLDSAPNPNAWVLQTKTAKALRSNLNRGKLGDDFQQDDFPLLLPPGFRADFFEYFTQSSGPLKLAPLFLHTKKDDYGYMMVVIYFLDAYILQSVPNMKRALKTLSFL